uniref:ANK_REP_REGION domain-containing protein n=1 Tax=Steinernema glaseri TaxID=37863 RepID=A0A1I7ZIQ0_9BILA
MNLTRDSSSRSMYWKEMDEVVANLFHFTDCNHVFMVERILMSDIRLVNVRDDDLLTCLHIATGNGSLEMVELLLNYGSDPNACDLLGTTPLFHAAANGNIDIVRELINAGANIAHISDLQTDVISIAVAYGHFEVVKFLQTCHPDQSSLLTPQRRLTVLAACLTTNFDVIMFFTLFWRSDIDAIWFPFGRLNALGLAVFLNNVDLVELLLDLGASSSVPSLNYLNAVELCRNLGGREAVYKCLTKHDAVKAGQRLEQRILASPLRSALCQSPTPQKDKKKLLDSYTMTDLKRLFASSWGDSSSKSLVDSVSEPVSRMTLRFGDSGYL